MHNPQDIPAAVIRRYRQGDHSAFNAIHQRYARVVYSKALIRLTPVFGPQRAHEHAETVTAEVFMAAWKLRARFDPKRAKLNTWLYAITEKRSIDAIRKDNRARSAMFELKLHTPSDGRSRGVAPNPIPITEVGADYLDRVRDISRERLTRRQRRVLYLHGKKGFSKKETAKKLGIEVRTVELHFKNALDRMREEESFRDCSLLWATSA